MSDLYGVQASMRVRDEMVRCRSCGKLWTDSFVHRPWRFTCPRCKTVNGSTAINSTAYPATVVASTS